jgi:hypothetical protein
LNSENYEENTAILGLNIQKGKQAAVTLRLASLSSNLITPFLKKKFC